MHNTIKIMVCSAVFLASSYIQAMQQQEDNDLNIKALYTDLLQARKHIQLESSKTDQEILEIKTGVINSFLKSKDTKKNEHKTLQAIQEYITIWLEHHCKYTFRNEKQKSSEHDSNCPHCQGKNMVQHITGKDPSPLFLQCCPSSDDTDNGNNSGNDREPIAGKAQSLASLKRSSSSDVQGTDNDNNSSHKKEVKFFKILLSFP